MKKISENEKQRILNLYESIPMKPWNNQLTEQNSLWDKIKSANKVFDLVNTYNTQNTNSLSQKQVSDIKSYVSSEAIREVPTYPFQNNAEGNKFRKWVNDKFPQIAQAYYLAPVGNKPDSYKNDLISRVWNHKYTYGHSLGTDGSSSTQGETKKLGDWFLLDIQMDKKMPEFYNRLFPIFEKSKTWWLNWLKNEDTIIKFKKLNNLWFDFQVDYWFSQYINLINSLSLTIFYSVNDDRIKKYGSQSGRGCRDGAIACVHPNSNVVNANIKYESMDDKAWFTNIVHEIQHLLYYVHPLTPDKSITKFRGDDNCYNLNKQKYESLKVADKDLKLLGQLKIDSNKIKSVASDLGVDTSTAQKILTRVLNISYSGWDTDYFRKDNSELTSRVSGTRGFLLYGTNRNSLSKNDFVKYLTSQNWIESDVNYLLGYWGSKGFPPLVNFVNELNTEFVKTDRTTTKQKLFPFDFSNRTKTGYA